MHANGSPINFASSLSIIHNSPALFAINFEPSIITLDTCAGVIVSCAFFDFRPLFVFDGVGSGTVTGTSSGTSTGTSTISDLVAP